MNKKILALIVFIVFSSHDMYLRMDTYFLQPNTSATIKLFNGTFNKSANTFDRDLMTDVSLFGNGRHTQLNDAQWSEKDSTSLLNFTTGESGTWIAGVSTAPRTTERTAEDFNRYLEHLGIVNMSDQRRKNNELENDAVEKYAKHVKTIFQVGDKKTNDWQTELGYPIEFMPLSNPYEARTGDSLRVKLLFKGEPLADQLVYVDYAKTGNGHSHTKDPSDDTGHHHGHGQQDAVSHGHSHESGETQEEGHEHEIGQEAEHGHSHTKDQSDDTGHHHGHGQQDAVAHGHSHKSGETQEEGHEHEIGQEAEHGHSHEQETEHTHSDDDDHKDDPEHGHSHEQAPEEKEQEHRHTSDTQIITDSNGIINMKLEADGIWYLRTIYLTNSEEPRLTHESNWATLTFEVTHRHGEDSHTHTDEAEESIPSYLYWIGSIILLVGLFFWFNRKT